MSIEAESCKHINVQMALVNWRETTSGETNQWGKCCHILTLSMSSRRTLPPTLWRSNSPDTKKKTTMKYANPTHNTWLHDGTKAHNWMEKLGFVSTLGSRRSYSSLRLNSWTPYLSFFLIVVLEMVKRFEYKLRRLLILATNLRIAQGGWLKPETAPSEKPTAILVFVLFFCWSW